MEAKGSTIDGADATKEDLPDADLKIILLGDSAVGKSKLIERYLMNEYNPRQVNHTVSTTRNCPNLLLTERYSCSC